MKASENASRETRMAMRRLASTQAQASYSRVPKRRWIGRQKVEEAKNDLESAEAFSRVVDKAVVVLDTVEKELETHAYSYAGSPSTEMQICKKQRRLSQMIEVEVGTTGMLSTSKDTETDLRKVYAFLRVVNEAAAVLNTVEKELETDTYCPNDSWSIEMRRHNKRRKPSQSQMTEVEAGTQELVHMLQACQNVAHEP